VEENEAALEHPSLYLELWDVERARLLLLSLSKSKSASSPSGNVDLTFFRAQTFALSLKNGLRRETIAPRGSLCAWDEGSEFLVGWPEVGGFWYMFLGVITEDFGEEVPEVDWL